MSQTNGRCVATPVAASPRDVLRQPKIARGQVSALLSHSPEEALIKADHDPLTIPEKL